MVVSNRMWSGLMAALPSVWVSLLFFDVYFHPEAGSNPQWGEDAKLLVKLEPLLIFVTVLTVVIAEGVTLFQRWATMGVLAVGFSAIVYGLWLATAGSDAILGAGLLIAGRFMAAVFAGPKSSAEYFERAVVGVLFYLAILAVVYLLPSMVSGRFSNLVAHPAVVFCALYYMLHAMVEGAQIYARSPQLPTSRRLTVDLESSDWLSQRRLQLRFVGDAVEIVRTERPRPAGRIGSFFLGSMFVVLGLMGMIETRGSAIALIGLLPLLMGGAIAIKSLRGGAGSESIVQARNGEIAVLQFENAKLDSMERSTAAEIDRLSVQQGDENHVHSRWLQADLRNGESRIIFYGIEQAQAVAFLRLVELYMKGDVRPPALRKALDADPELAAMIGPQTIERLLAMAPVTERTGTMACPACGREIAASAPRCAYCGALYPGLDG